MQHGFKNQMYFRHNSHILNSKHPIRVNNHLTSHFWYAIMILRHNEIFFSNAESSILSLACIFYLYDKNAGSILAYQSK